MFLLDGYRDGFWGGSSRYLRGRGRRQRGHASARNFRELFRGAGFAQISQASIGGRLPSFDRRRRHIGARPGLYTLKRGRRSRVDRDWECCP